MRRLRSFFLRFVGLFTGRKIESRVSQEIEGHLAMHIEDNLRSGMNPEEARRQALLKLGGMAQARELYRDRSRLPLIETFLQDLRYGARMLRKNTGFTTVAIVTLALGIGANTAIFSVVDGILLRPLPYHDPARLMSVYNTAPTRNLQRFGASPPDFRLLRAENHSLASLSSYIGALFNLTGTGAPERVQAEVVSAEYFTTLGVQPVLGRQFRADEEQWGSHRVVILSYGFWHAHFNNNPNISALALKLDGDTYNVVGVMPVNFSTQNDPEIWVPMAFQPKDNLDSHNNYFLNLTFAIAENFLKNRPAQGG